MEGYIKLYKKIFKNPIFKDEPMSEREAWIWLLCNAVYRKVRGRYGNFVITLQRGQLVGGSEYLSDIFQWNSSRVRRFVKRLQKDDMIGTQTDEGITVITIRNYSEYQFSHDNSDEVTTIDRLDTDYNKRNNSNNKNIYNVDFEYIWENISVKKGSKKKAFIKFRQLNGKVTKEDIVTKYNYLLSTINDPTYYPHLVSWLNGERWNEEIQLGEQAIRKLNGLGVDHKYHGFIDGKHQFLYDMGFAKEIVCYNSKGEKI